MLIVSILRILTVRFGILEEQQGAIKAKLDQFEDLTKLDELEERALRAFTFAEFTGDLDRLLPHQHTNGSAR